MWYQGFNRNFTKLREYFLYAKKTKITSLFNNLSPPRHPSAILESIHWTQTAYAVLCQLRHADTLFSFKSKRKWRKQRIYVTQLTKKKYFRSFVKLQLNPWYHMDYFTDLLATFLNVDRVNHIAVYGRVRELSECIKNILIWVTKSNKDFTGLERHGVSD